MTTYVEYELEDGSVLLIEAEENKTGGVRQASKDKDGNIIQKSGAKFQDALTGVKASARLLREQLNELEAEEVEVTFGLKTTGEAGLFAVGKVGVEANYTVKLKWGKGS
jgi:hypothetical protein